MNKRKNKLMNLEERQLLAFLLALGLEKLQEKILEAKIRKLDSMIEAHERLQERWARAREMIKAYDIYWLEIKIGCRIKALGLCRDTWGQPLVVIRTQTSERCTTVDEFSKLSSSAITG